MAAIQFAKKQKIIKNKNTITITADVIAIKKACICKP
jgi:hypothetical protein